MLLAAGDSTTTTISTWLVPILAALVAGTAGVAGTLLGGRGATRAAERSAALARQDEQRRWNRERRERAYGAMLDARDQCVEEFRGMAARVARVPADEALRGGWWTEVLKGTVSFGRAVAALRAARVEVERYGSPAARSSADAWVDVLESTFLSVDGEDGWQKAERTLATNEAQLHRETFLALFHAELGLAD